MCNDSVIHSKPPGADRGLGIILTPERQRDPVPVIKYWWSLIGESEILQQRERELGVCLHVESKWIFLVSVLWRASLDVAIHE